MIPFRSFSFVSTLCFFETNITLLYFYIRTITALHEMTLLVL